MLKQMVLMVQISHYDIGQSETSLLPISNIFNEWRKYAAIEMKLCGILCSKTAHRSLTRLFVLERICIYVLLYSFDPIKNVSNLKI